MLEWLKTILGDTYTEDIDKKVSEEIGKGFVARADFNALNETKKALDGQIKDRDKQLDDLKKSSGDNAELQKQIEELQSQNKTVKAEYETNLKKVTLDSKIETALMGAKVKNTRAARALLDETKLSLDGNNLIGLDAQIEALKKSDAYLFGDNKPLNPPAPAGGNPPKTFTKESIANMSTEEINKNWNEIQKIL